MKWKKNSDTNYNAQFTKNRNVGQQLFFEIADPVSRTVVGRFFFCVTKSSVMVPSKKWSRGFLICCLLFEIGHSGQLQVGKLDTPPGEAGRILESVNRKRTWTPQPGKKAWECLKIRVLDRFQKFCEFASNVFNRF